MDGYNFTERVRKTLVFSREEAGRLRHEYVGTEHILLGLLKEGEGVASTVLESLHIKPEAIRARVEETAKKGKAELGALPDLPYTSRAKKVLECSMLEAREMGHTYVGTEHLLLGLLREEKGIGAMVLIDAGLTLEKARAETLSILGTAMLAKKDEMPADYMMGYRPLSAGASLIGDRTLSISAILSWLIGLTLVFDPVGFEARMNLVIDDRVATIAQAQGAILIGLGFINWLMRKATDRGALIAVFYGNFVVQALSFAIVLRALVRGLVPAAGAGALVLHVLLGAAFAWQLMRLRRG